MSDRMASSSAQIPIASVSHRPCAAWVPTLSIVVRIAPENPRSLPAEAGDDEPPCDQKPRPE